MKSRLSFFAICLAFTACGEESGPIEVAGDWASNFGFDETISDLTWGTASVISFDNDENFAVTQQPAEDMFNPSKFGKVVWTEPANGRFHYCIVDFGLETAAEAEATSKSADAKDPENSGCGGFSWTRLQEPIEIAGTYSSMWGQESVTSYEWGTNQIDEYDNEKNFAITQNPADDMFNPSKFNVGSPGTELEFAL